MSSDVVEAIRSVGVLHLGGAFIDCEKLAAHMDTIGWTGTPKELAEVDRRLKLTHEAMVEVTR